jgi:sporulation protein YlmC with PRC-barrel domain
MKSTKASIAAGACAVLGLACGPAQSQGQAVPMAASAALPDDSRGKTAARLDTKWVSAIVGMKIVTPAGASLGKVNEVIVDGYGRATFALVSYGGVFGVGTKYTALPWAVVAELLDRDRLVVEKASLENAPQLLKAKPGADDRQWRVNAEDYWKRRLQASR